MSAFMPTPPAPPPPPPPSPPPSPSPPAPRRRAWLWVALGAVALLLIGVGSGSLFLFVKARDKLGAVVRPGHSVLPRATGPNGAPLAGPSHAATWTGVPCQYLPADRGGGEPRLVGTPAPQATRTGRINASITTNLGAMSVDLLADKAPCTVHSFAHLAQEDYYTDTPCHRLTTEGLWVLQCGDPSGTGTGTPGYQFGEENLPTASPSYPRGSLAMANAGPGTNGAQFFIVYRDSDIPPDYTIFGTVVAGMDLLERIAAAGTDNGSTDSHPKLDVRINEITFP
jgi:peptidyl-prolyl cis-trans isomerase B (cyclophilin B)